jgi:hypothetical protein
VHRLFDVAQWQNYAEFADRGHSTEEAGHGRIERRRCVALACPVGEPFNARAGIQSVVMVESMRQTVCIF